MILHALLDHAQRAAAADLRGGQGTGHQEGAQTASGHHEVGVGSDALGGPPADEQHHQQIEDHDHSDCHIKFHSFSPSFLVC